MSEGTFLQKYHRLICKEENCFHILNKEREEVMKQGAYAKGNFMTFPLELTQLEEMNYLTDNKYLYPAEVNEIQKEIEEVCDKMEYDGSVMYDEFPDKITIEAMSKDICNRTECRYQEEISNRWKQALIQMLLCNEMSYRRERRRCHKKNMGLC